MRILVASHRPPVRDGVALALDARYPGADVRTAAAAADCAELLERWTPQVALVDADLPRSGALPVCSRLAEVGTRPLVIVAGGPSEALRLLESGVSGIVSGREGLDDLVEAVQVVMEGHTHVPSAMLGGVLHGLIARNREQETARDRLQRLTQREREVLGLLAKGRDQVGIARSLTISPHTAKTHIRHVMAKLEVSSRIEAAAVAAELGVGLDPAGGRT